MAKTYIEKGALVPDHVMTRLILPRLEEMTHHNWLLDGTIKKCNYFIAIYFAPFLLASNGILDELLNYVIHIRCFCIICLCVRFSGFCGLTSHFSKI